MNRHRATVAAVANELVRCKVLPSAEVERIVSGIRSGGEAGRRQACVLVEPS